jgi:hypothetical protein
MESLFNTEFEEKKITKKLNKAKAKKITGIVIWTLVYIILVGLIVMFVVYGIGYALLQRDLTSKNLEWVSNIRTDFNAWKGDREFVDIGGFVLASIILSVGLFVGVIISHDNYNINQRKKLEKAGKLHK